MPVGIWRHRDLIGKVSVFIGKVSVFIGKVSVSIGKVSVSLDAFRRHTLYRQDNIA